MEQSAVQYVCDYLQDLGVIVKFQCYRIQQTYLQQTPLFKNINKYSTQNKTHPAK